MGPVGAAIVTATFYSLSPDLIGEVIPRASTPASPEAISRLGGGSPTPRYAGCWAIGSFAEVAQAAELIRRATEGLDVSGRPLFAAHTELPRPGSRTSPRSWARPREQRPQPVQLEDVPDPDGRNRWVTSRPRSSPAHPTRTVPDGGHAWHPAASRLSGLGVGFDRGGVALQLPGLYLPCLRHRPLDLRPHIRHRDHHQARLAGVECSPRSSNPCGSSRPPRDRPPRPAPRRLRWRPRAGPRRSRRMGTGPPPSGGSPAPPRAAPARVGVSCSW